MEVRMNQYFVSILLTAVMLVCCAAYAPRVTAESEFYFDDSFNDYEPGTATGLTAPLSLKNNGVSEIVNSDRGRSLSFSVGNKNLSLVEWDLKPYISNFSGKFQVGFSVKDVSLGIWGHRQIMLTGTNSSGQKLQNILVVFSKVTHLIIIGGENKRLYKKSIWYDVVMNFDTSGAEKYVDISVTTPFDSSVREEGRVSLEDFKNITMLSLISGVTSDTSESVTMYDDLYIKSVQALRVTGISPQDTAGDVSISKSIIITFNNPLNLDTVNKEHIKLTAAGAPVEGYEVGVDRDKKRVVIQQSGGKTLAAGCDHTISLIGVEDTDGGMISDTSYTFSTSSEINISDIVFKKKGEAGTLSRIEACTIEATADVSFADGVEGRAVLFLVLYQKVGGILINIALDTAETQNDTLSVALRVPDESEDYCLYAYLWSGSDTQKPLTRASRLY